MATDSALEYVEPTDLVLRRVPALWIVLGENGTLRPSGQAFNNDGDGEPMSCYLDSDLKPNKLTRADVLIDHDGFFLAGLVVQDLIDEEQDVYRDPIVPAVHLCDPAHVSVAGSKGSGRRRRLAKASLWVRGLCPDNAVVGLEADA